MLISTLENVLNRGLPGSPRARQLCRQLEGRRVAVEISGITRLLIESTGETLRITRDASASAPAEIVGGPMSLFALIGESPEEPIQRGDVQIRGDTDIASRFRELALLLRPDLEEELSRVIGDVPAHQIGRFARAAFGWTRRAASTTVRNVAEYLAHERQHLVPRAEADQYLKGVDELREGVDRLEARIQLLAAARSGAAASSKDPPSA